MANLKPLTRQRWVINIDEATEITFDTCSGVQVEYSQTDFNDGVTGQTKTAVGFLKNSNVTLGKVADEETDAPLRSWLANQAKAATPFNLAIRAVTVNKAGDPLTSYEPIKCTQCSLVRVKYPEPDRTSSDLAKWEVEIVVNGDVT